MPHGAATVEGVEAPAYLLEFAERVRLAREARGLTPRELAFRAHTGQSHVIHLETCERQGRATSKVLITTLWKLAVGLEVRVTWLAFGGGPVPDRVAVTYDELRVRTAFYERAKFAREARGLRQKDLAERLKTSQANVSAIEHGVQGATLGTLHLYREGLDLTPEWLMDTAEAISWPC